MRPESAATGAVCGVPADLPGGDDDGDGLVDEDLPDGLDQDGDGLIDEDFAQHGAQMFTCVMRDDDAITRQMFPDHRPFGLEVRQDACAWDTPGYENVVGLRYTIANTGVQPIHDVYVGFMVDGDIGRHDDPDAGSDDLAGTFDGLVRQPEGYYEDMGFAWMRDADAVDALPGWLGIDINGDGLGDVNALRPEHYGVHALRILDVDYSQGYGGVPYLDSERYAILADPGADPDVHHTRTSDYIVIVSVGPYERMDPGEYIIVDIALVVAPGWERLLESIRVARDLRKGRWHNADNSYWSGAGGSETLICAEDFGLPWDSPTNPLYRRYPQYWDESCMPPPPQSMPWPFTSDDMTWYPDRQKHCVWVDTDNCDECSRYNGYRCTATRPGYYNCSRNNGRSRGACTGMFGRESRIPWVAGESLPPPPWLRVVPRDRAMEIYWDDRSEHERDEITGELDFESYRVWRADEWDRPVGTNESTGPPVGSWELISEYDLVNFFPHGETEIPRSFGRNTGLERAEYVPVCLDDPVYEGLAEVMAAVVLADTDGTMEVLPPLRDRDGVPTAGLEALLTWEMFPDVLDTFFAVTPRPEEVGSPKRAIRYYMHRDEPLHNGFVYFYSVTATDHVTAPDGQSILEEGESRLPSGSFAAAVPRFAATSAAQAAAGANEVIVYPNPATRESLAEFQAMHPNAADPTGVRVAFARLPACRCTIRIFTISGDLVQTIEHDGVSGAGQAYWNLTTRNGQEVVSGIYLFAVSPRDRRFEDFVGKFVVVR